MDIISMQLANKVLKKINTEYNGFMDIQVAAIGQTVFTLPKEYAVGGNTLNVYVDGALAYVNQDYIETNANTITFNQPLENSEVVLFKTNVAGIPKFPILNPPYDDTQVRSLIANNADEIVRVEGKVDAVSGNLSATDGEVTSVKGRMTTAEEQISNIIAVLDADGDGSIIDHIADLQAQWESADGDLQALIANKVEQEAFNTLNSEIVNARGTFTSLKGQLDELASKISANADNIILAETDIGEVESDIVDIQSDITAIGSTLTTLTNSITSIDSKISTIESAISELQANSGKATELKLTDTATGWQYNVLVTNGVLRAELVKVLASALIERASTGNIYVGDTIYFNAAAKYQDGSDATDDATMMFSINDELKASIDSLSGQLTALAIGDVTVKVTATVGTASVEGSTAISIVINKMEKVATAKANLTIGELSSVTADIVLPLTQDDCQVSWSSNDASTITTTGLVTRPSGLVGDKQVVLTATISYDEANDTKAFVATVVALPVTDTEKLGIASANFDSSISIIDWSNLTSDFTVNESQDEATVAWSVPANSYVGVISNGDGTALVDINRPSGPEGNQLVTFSATLSVGAEQEVKTYPATILALPWTDVERVDLAKANLTLGDTTAVVDSLVLPTIQNNCDVTWTSSDETVVAVDGAVVRPVNGVGNVDVTLTATIAYGTASDTKVFTITVLEAEPIV